MSEYYPVPKIIQFLEQRNFEKFNIGNQYAGICTPEYCELVLDASNDSIAEENIILTIAVLTNLDECVRKAQPWLSHFNLKHDRWYPDALDAGYEISGIFVGTFDYGGPYKSPTKGFTISFSTKNYYSEQFTVKYNTRLWSFVVEEWVE